MAMALHPKFRIAREAIRTYVIGVLDSVFRHQYGTGMQEGITAYQYQRIEKIADEAALTALRGYVRVMREHRKAVHHRKRRRPKRR